MLFLYIYKGRKNREQTALTAHDPEKYNTLPPNTAYICLKTNQRPPMTARKQFLTPTEIIEKLNGHCPYSPSEIGTLLSLGLVNGNRRSRMVLIDLESFLTLIQYRNDLIETRKVKF